LSTVPGRFDEGSRLPDRADALDIIRSIVEMNEALADVEPRGEHPPTGPVVLVFGLPRSGTTLTYQLLCSALRVGYIDNVAARFWLAPSRGIALSKALLGDRRDTTFRSTYGKSDALEGPHEFSYFWQAVLGIDDVEDLLDFGNVVDRDFHGMARALGAIERALEANALAFRTNYAVQFAEQFAEVLPAPIFVEVQRDAADVAVSILRARRAHFGSSTEWWATPPPSYRQLKRQPAIEQIVGQVLDLRAVYDEHLGRLPAELVVRLTYAEVCARPEAAVEAVRSAIAGAHGVTVPLAEPAPGHFEHRRALPRDDEERELVALLASKLAG
jgi:hypothetical protein